MGPVRFGERTDASALRLGSMTSQFSRAGPSNLPQDETTKEKMIAFRKVRPRVSF